MQFTINKKVKNERQHQKTQELNTHTSGGAPEQITITQIITNKTIYIDEYKKLLNVRNKPRIIPLKCKHVRIILTIFIKSGSQSFEYASYTDNFHLKTKNAFNYSDRFIFRASF